MCDKVYKISIVILSVSIFSLSAFGEKIGISYDQVMKTFTNSFTMEKSTPVKGQERYMGKTTDGLAILEIIGNKQNIIKAILLVATPKDAPNIVLRNAKLSEQFVKNIFSEREKEASDWLAYAMNKLAQSNLEIEEKIFDNKKIMVRKILPLGIGITVECSLIDLGQFNLEVSGIVYEEKGQSYAVVNELIVKVGEKIGEAEVVEIAKDFVKFKYGDSFFVKKLKPGVIVESSKQEKDISIPMRPEKLSLEIRKKIFYELIEAENKAAREAKAKYPSSEALNKRIEMNRSLIKKYRQEVRNEYNISEDQELEIAAEGIENYWPQPPWEVW